MSKSDDELQLEARQKIFSEITAERLRQIRRWGDQTHEFPTWLTILIEEIGEAVKSQNEGRKWRHELVESAAVLVAWLEDVDR